MNRIKKQRKYSASRSRQRGVILVLFTVGMLVIIVMAGLALDISHALLNKSRLQNTVDAAALTAAKTLDQTNSTSDASNAALALFASNSGTPGNGEMAADVSASDIAVEFSATLDPFNVGSSPAEYVRVRVETFTLGSWLIQLIGFNDKVVRASAVAGPSPTIGSACDIVPLIVCGDPAAGGPLWGYQQDDITVLKGSSKSGSQAGPIGPGNFQLARLGGSGASIVRDNLAGAYEGCAIVGDAIPTQPGNAVGPVAQGLNTRLNEYLGPISPGDYPPDVIVEEQQGAKGLEYDAATGAVTLRGQVVTKASAIDFNYDDYQARINAGNYDIAPSLGGAFDRRNLSVVIADCSGKNNGASDLPILGLGCYFLLQKVRQQGTEAEVYGQFLEQCEASGNVGPDPAEVPGPYLIQLYKDPDSRDS